MKEIKQIKRLSTLIAVCIILLTGCAKEPRSITNEPIKDIVGSWKVVKLIRNEEDLSSRINFENFRIVFSEDGTYSLKDKMAFVVMKPGTYQLDDPQYPFFLSLKPEGNTDVNKIKLSLPITSGKRQISLTMSPGCSSNTYKYTFEKVQ